MRRACSFAFVCLLVLTTLCVAAPSPLPRQERGRYGDVLLDAQTAERVRLARLYLKSNDLLDKLLQAKSIRPQMASLADAEGRRAWLRERMQVNVRGTLVEVRVSGLAPASITELLETVMDVLVEKPAPLDDSSREAVAVERHMALALRHEYMRRLESLRRLQAVAPRGASSKDIEAAEQVLARYEFAAKPMRLHRGLRMVR